MAPSSALYVLLFCLKAHGQNNSRGRSDGHRLPHTLHTLSWLHFLQLLGADGKSLDVLRTQIGIPSSPASPQPLPLQPISLSLSLFQTPTWGVGTTLTHWAFTCYPLVRATHPPSRPSPHKPSLAKERTILSVYPGCEIPKCLCMHALPHVVLSLPMFLIVVVQ